MLASLYICTIVRSLVLQDVKSGQCQLQPTSHLVVTHLQVHQQTLRVTNTTKASVDGEVKASSSDRYSIHPASFRLKPGEATELTVSLKLDFKFAQRRKAIETGQRDAFFIKVDKRNLREVSRITQSIAYDLPSRGFLLGRPPFACSLLGALFSTMPSASLPGMLMPGFPTILLFRRHILTSASSPPSSCTLMRRQRVSAMEAAAAAGHDQTGGQ